MIFYLQKGKRKELSKWGQTWGDLAAQLVVVLLDLHQHLGGVDVAPAVG